MMNKLRMLLSIVLHTIPHHALEGMQTLIPQLLIYMTCWRTLIPSQINLDFLIQHQHASEIPLDHQLEMLVSQPPTPLHGTHPNNTMVLYTPQIHKKIDIHIHPSHNNNYQCLDIF